MIGDVRDDKLARKAMRHVDYVFHLAGLPPRYRGAGPRRGTRRERPGHAQRAPGRRHRGCPAGGVRLLRLHLRHHRRAPIGEDRPALPVSVFAASKLAGEIYCRAYHASRHVETVLLRYFTVYGPAAERGDPGGLRARPHRHGAAGPPTGPRRGRATAAGLSLRGRRSGRHRRRRPRAPRVRAGDERGLRATRHAVGVLGIVNRPPAHRRRCPGRAGRARSPAAPRGRTRRSRPPCSAAPRVSFVARARPHRPVRSPKRSRREDGAPRRGGVAMKNALTFDVEEYFHAEAFAGCCALRSGRRWRAG